MILNCLSENANLNSCQEQVGSHNVQKNPHRVRVGGAWSGERKREKSREGGVVFSDMEFYFSITSFSKADFFFLMSVIYSNKNKSTKNWEKTYQFQNQNFKKYFEVKKKDKTVVNLSHGEHIWVIPFWTLCRVCVNLWAKELD